MSLWEVTKVPGERTGGWGLVPSVLVPMLYANFVLCLSPVVYAGHVVSVGPMVYVSPVVSLGPMVYVGPVASLGPVVYVGPVVSLGPVVYVGPVVSVGPMVYVDHVVLLCATTCLEADLNGKVGFTELCLDGFCEVKVSAKKMVRALKYPSFFFFVENIPELPMICTSHFESADGKNLTSYYQTQAFLL